MADTRSSTEAPLDLDPETRLEWEKWVGRRILIRSGLVGFVVSVRRKVLNRYNALSPEREAEVARLMRMNGDCWWATVEWVSPKGAVEYGTRCTSWLQPVDADPDTRVPPQVREACPSSVDKPRR